MWLEGKSSEQWDTVPEKRLSELCCGGRGHTFGKNSALSHEDMPKTSPSSCIPVWRGVSPFDEWSIPMRGMEYYTTGLAMSAIVRGWIL